ncbi:MAG TPA: hypothetical protein VME92_22550 [Acetobacteraceae bacterium]|nr:hypothetical protein [Acetobacteraceae bacterium]
MAALFSSGAIADIVVAVMLAEAVGLGLHWRCTGSGLDPAASAAMLAPGLLLLLALRVALDRGWWGWMALALAGAGLAHGLDLAQRARR